MTELKPCPFCGEKADIYLGDSSDGYIKGTQYIEAYCNRCGARIKSHYVADAIEAWNSRPNPWHTGTPSEEGDYLLVLKAPQGKPHYFPNTLNKGKKWRYVFRGAIIAWQKIEPYKEKEQ